MKKLCEAIIYAACFLELSDDSTVDPHAAVKALEDIGSSLLSATDEEKGAFIDACKEEALRLRGKPGYTDTAEFVRSLPYAVGLTSEP